MKIKRSVLKSIIKEELTKHLKSLMEAEGDEKKEKKPEPKGPPKKDKEEKPAKMPPPGASKKDDKPTKMSPELSAGAEKATDKEKPEKLPTEPEPADDDLEKDSEDEADVTGGEIADEITGKTIQSISMDPKSKLMPGATEITLTFDQIPEPLKILITKTGQIKFYLRGLHNTL